MANIDITLPDHLQAALAKPICLDLKLPPPGKVSITLPTGGSLKGIQDFTKGIPDDCSVMFSLLAQLPPLLASMECIIKILNTLKALQDVISSLPFPPVEAIKKFIEACAELAPCFLIPTPAAMIPFVKDILCLVIKIMTCMIGQLESVVNIAANLKVQIDFASGNPELLGTLQCAQENAAISAQHSLAAMESITVLMSMIEPLMKIAGAPSIAMPELGATVELDKLQDTIQGLKDFVTVLTSAADLLGGC